ncbi:MAG: polysaccharide deacetylase family protein [Nitrososphaerales archaeon]
MKLLHLAAISTGIVIALGILMVAPAFTQMRHQTPKSIVMLSFSVVDDTDVLTWCNELSSVLNKHNIKATVFVTGKIAEQYPQCVTDFVNNIKIDIGSQTYNYVDLTSISDYSIQLEEVRNGKLAIDEAGRIYSRVFKAPYGATDDNIYSILSRSDIIADFSYDKRYNKYYNDQFIWFTIDTYSGSTYSASFFQTLPVLDTPIIISFDNLTSSREIDTFISQLKSSSVQFVNASELTGLELTIRGSI